MESLTNLVTAVLAVAGFISAVCAAGNWIVKVVAALKAPNAKQDEDIAELKEWRKSVDEKLNNDNDRLNKIRESDRITQQALLALLAHGIDGNHQKQMEEAKDALQHHLINQ